jgi:hypothetical protein
VFDVLRSEILISKDGKISDDREEVLGASGERSILRRDAVEFTVEVTVCVFTN